MTTSMLLNESASEEILKVGQRRLMERPIRAQVLTKEELGERGILLSEQDEVEILNKRSRALRERFNENCKILEEAYFTLAEAGRQREVLEPGAEWLLDNFHIVEQHVAEVRKYFPQGYDKTLPKLKNRELGGYPRVYHIALDIVAHTDANVDTELLSAFVAGYQTNTYLTTGELWAIPIMLKFALIENLRRLIAAITSSREKRIEVEAALGAVFDTKPSDRDGKGTDLLLTLAHIVANKPDLITRNAVHLLRKLRQHGQRFPLALQWFEERLREQEIDPDELVREYHQHQAFDQVSIGNSITSLRTLSAINWREWFESVSIVDKVLHTDPSGLYGLCDFHTRDHYRHQIERYARWTGRSEFEIAESLLSVAKERAAVIQNSFGRQEAHVGYYLIGDGREEFEKRIQVDLPPAARFERTLKQNGFYFYILGLGILTTALMVAAMAYAAQHGGGALTCLALLLVFAIPATDVANNLIQWFINHVTPPTLLPKLHLDHGISAEDRTLVTVHGIFDDKDSLEKSVEGLEVRYLGNDDPNLFFSILADLPDRKEREYTEDLWLMEYAKGLIKDLNEKHGIEGTAKFYIFFRERRWNDLDKKLMGWERKRGKITEINRLILGDETTSFIVTDEEKALLRSIRYIITLDGDSQLPGGTAKKLIGTIAHPLNRAVIDPKTGTVRKGYGIIQPRVSVSLTSANTSRFSKVFSGHAGLDPYTQTVSDFYQDLFDEGSYIGKGVYDVHAFEESLRNRVPENALLSHDLFEGLFARVGLASDVELFDEFPTRYNVYAKRQHRWVRGDWQIMPWVFGRVPSSDRTLKPTVLSPLARWKLADNLRRSLVAPSLLLFLSLSFVLLPGSPLFWLSLAVLVVAFPIYTHLASVFIIPPLGLSLSTYVKGMGSDLLKHSQQALYSFAFLPHQAYLMVHAIAVTLYRLYVTKKNFLEWETAYHSEKRLGTDLSSFVSQMRPSLYLALGITVACLFIAPSHLLYLAPFIAGWIAAPQLAYRLSVALPHQEIEMTVEEKSYLETLAYDTWTYFREHLTEEHNYLIPDNLQLTPQRVVAPRTSPTNISLSLLTVASSYTCGYEPMTTTVERLGSTFDSLGKLERFHGHLLNWYDTTNLRSLHPRYVSTVDSGNFVGHLVALTQYLGALEQESLITALHISHLKKLIHQHVLQVRDDTIQSLVSFLDDGVGETQLSIATAAALLTRVRQDFGRLRPEMLQQLLFRVPELSSLLSLERWFEWYEPLVELSRHSMDEQARKMAAELLHQCKTATPSPRTLRAILSELAALFEERQAEDEGEEQRLAALRGAVREGLIAIAAFSERVAWLQDECEKYIKEADFSFLYDGSRGLFPVGYNVDNARKDAGYYDLLASEARLASLVSIAKGDVPQKHWFALGRSLADTYGGKALLSWSGTMFEYLMPLVVMKNFEPTLLSETYKAVVETQRHYAARRKVPWGISESAYSGVDFHSTYQYKAFGVPGLGLKRGLETDLVVSPYSTVLSLPISFRNSWTNLHDLEREGLRGEYGFYEAVDYTRDRLSGDATKHVVKSFFAHHQGMSFLSIVNILHGNILQEYFHADPRIKAVELLMHEKFPQRIPLSEPRQAAISFVDKQIEEEQVARGRIYTSPHTYYPQTHLLSNGRLTTMVDNAGSGMSLFDKDTLITRWREDGVVDNYGYFIFIRDVDSGKVWSVTYQPTRVEPETYEVFFNADKVEFKRSDFKILTYTEITVAQEDNTEVRRVTLTNMSGRKRSLELTTYAEVALAAMRADIAHPAFAKMFIESEFDVERDALIFSRRRRSMKEEPLYLFHSMTMKTCWAPTQYDTSRMEFLGRGRTVADPIAMEKRSLNSSEGPILDPVMSLRTRVELDPGQSETVAFCTGIAKSREEIENLVLRYKDLHHVTRAFELAWSQSSVELRNEQFTNKQSHYFQRLGTALLFSIDKLRAKPEVISKNRMTQSALWRFGISGDAPIVLVKVADPSQSSLVREAILAHHYLHSRGISFDLVILNEYPGGYFQHFQEELGNMLRASPRGSMIDKKGGLFLKAASQLSKEELILLQTVARVVLDGSAGTMEKQLALDDSPAEIGPIPVVTQLTTPVVLPRQEGLADFTTSFGRFTKGGKAYEMMVSSGRRPPLPWSNVIASRSFGTLVTEAGGGYTWSENSRENRLTPWSNDPVSDPTGEVIYIRDIETGEYWSPTPAPVKNDAVWRVEHGFGYSLFEGRHNNVGSELKITLAGEDKLKWYRLSLSNKDRFSKRLELYLYIDPVLGVSRDDSARYITSSFDAESQCLYMQNFYNNEFAGRMVFIGSSLNVVSYTTDRLEFVGRNRDLSTPLSLEKVFSKPTNIRAARRSSVRLSQRSGSGYDQCGVIKVQVTLEAGEEKQVLFFLGETDSVPTLRSNITRYRSLQNQEVESEKALQSWEELTQGIEVKTPSRSFDILLNGWLTYQTLSCRVFGRTGFYQSGGAFGFRDQLQDVLALLPTRPDITRAQILLHASRQFVEGDVQHWWHPPTGRGVRTKISDDYLWLPYVVCRYIERTGDTSLLNEEVSYIEGPQLGDQHEAYIVPHDSHERGTIYDHCIRAIERATPTGIHGLPLMGCGDWNDGMNEVGKDGKGESVWLAWFLSLVLKDFSVIAEERDPQRAAMWRRRAQALVDAIEANAWDGRWYRRAYFDDGKPMGSSQNDECRIDSLAQTWSIIAGGGSKERSQMAMQEVYSRLVDTENKVVRLLTPAFDKGTLNPGYIKGYLPGIRENGGQYTHAGAWVVIATALMGDGKRAFELFQLMNPITHTRSDDRVSRYKGEPYVLCGDVYAVTPHEGRAGWSWYTGSSGWLLQAGIQHILGFRVTAESIEINPCIPPEWEGFSLTYRQEKVFEVKVVNPHRVSRGVQRILVNGIEQPDRCVPLAIEGEKVEIEVLMGPEA